MATFDFDALTGGNAAPATAATAARAPRKQPKVWLNFGNVTEVTAEDGTVSEMFIGMPIGIGLDTMEPAQSRTSNQGFAQLEQAKNGILEFWKSVAEKLAPGDEVILKGDNHAVQIRRVAEAAAPAAGENPYMAAVASINFGK